MSGFEQRFARGRSRQGLAKGSLPGWTKRWTKQLPKGARLVQVQSAGGVAYTITYVLVITNDQVRSVWLDAAASSR